MNRFLSLTPQEIGRLQARTDLSQGIAAKVRQAYNYLVTEQASFDGEEFPLTDCYGSMVRAIHEGICPTCGCGLLTHEFGTPNNMGQCSIKGKCRNDHDHTAEPSEDGYGDWVAW